jgi:uncharacterized protein YecA (UPF0149 family)
MARGSASTGNLNYSAGGGMTAMQEAKAAAGEPVSTSSTTTQRRVENKVGRNDPCPCGSGKKYKQCHGRLD